MTYETLLDFGQKEAGSRMMFANQLLFVQSPNPQNESTFRLMLSD